MGFRFRDLSVHVSAMARVERGTGCGPCTATPQPEKAPPNKPQCPAPSQKPGPEPRCQAPSQKPGKDGPRQAREALDLLRLQLLTALAQGV